ncbi:response regulator [Rhodoplanes sp. TEM]|uniref:Response regulator n=1 Tax=Rhodoplanes tepidamans TaxID=200616 RepID=A0ABT5JJG8_RHOTP|nr:MULTISPECIES: response regulator [Rhodoplanes]MDC7789885.1 response regulator [Rhodoplanes tepidamans]MDC7988117.1 response regulator [Rhodoplanes sp. TEM]MDQ0355311.1 CheY-like chemotaxis protein [Rhodoplanes tepidamans]
MDKADGAADSKNILVVEDEIMIRMLLEDMLGDLGYTIAGAVGRIDDAVKLAKAGAFDLAILDVNLNGQTVSPVAEILEERGVPFVFATGYGERGLPEKFMNRPTLQKPFQQENLSRILSQAFDRAAVA